MKKYCLLLCVVLFFNIGVISFAEEVDAGNILSNYNVWSSTLPNGWSLETLISDSEAEHWYRVAAREVERACGATCHIDWSTYAIAYCVDFTELAAVQDLQKCADIFNNPVVYIPIYAEIDGDERVTAFLKLFYDGDGVAYCSLYCYEINEDFIDGKYVDFWMKLGYVESDEVIAYGEDIQALILVADEKKTTNCVILTYSENEKWVVYDYSNRAWFDEGEEREVLPLEDFVARKIELGESAEKANADFPGLIYGGSASVSNVIGTISKIVWWNIAGGAVVAGIALITIVVLRRRCNKKCG